MNKVPHKEIEFGVASEKDAKQILKMDSDLWKDLALSYNKREMIDLITKTQFTTVARHKGRVVGYRLRHPDVLPSKMVSPAKMFVHPSYRDGRVSKRLEAFSMRAFHSLFDAKKVSDFQFKDRGNTVKGQRFLERLNYKKHELSQFKIDQLKRALDWGAYKGAKTLEDAIKREQNVRDLEKKIHLRPEGKKQREAHRRKLFSKKPNEQKAFQDLWLKAHSIKRKNRFLS